MLSKNTRMLPDAYLKTEESNNNKMLLLQELAVSELVDDLGDIDESADLFSAYGKTLDLYGEAYGQRRGDLSDEHYRHMILAKILASTTNADANSVAENFLRLFNVQGSLGENEFAIVDSETPATIRIERFPLKALKSSGFSGVQAAEIMRALLPIGITLETVNFEGTFEFSDGANEYDESAGFANNSLTIGGEFGTTDSDTTEPVRRPVMVWDDGQGNVTVTGLEIDDEGHGSVTVAGLEVTDKNGNVVTV